MMTLSSRGSGYIDFLIDLRGNDNSDLIVHFITCTTCALATIYLDQHAFYHVLKREKLAIKISIPPQ